MKSLLASLALLTVACGATAPTGGNTPPPPPPPPAPPGTVTQTLGSAGGTITVSQTGTAIDGMSILVPSGAFPGSQTVVISSASSAAFPHPAGSTVISPLISIQTSDGRLASTPMLITIPVTVPSGSFPQIVLRSPVTGRQRALPTVDWTATSVTAMTGHFNPARLMGSNGSVAPSTSAGLRDPAASGDLAVVAFPLDQLALDHDTQFRPGVDNWEFRSDETVIEDNTNEGSVATEVWYYIAQKASLGPLWKKFQEVDGIEASNRRGLRWTSVAESAIYDRLTDGINSVAAALVASGRGTPGTVRQRLTVASFNAVRSALTSSPGEPQVVLFFNSVDVVASMLIYRSNGQQLFGVDPNNPGNTVVIDFSSGNLAPVTFGAATTPYTIMVAPGMSLLEDEGELPSQFDAVLDGTIGEEDFPTYRPMVAWGNAANERTELKDGILYAFDTDSPVMWVDCITCFGDDRIASIPPSTEKVALMEVFTQKGTAPWVYAGGAFGLASNMASPGDKKVGANLASHRPTTGTKFYWLDWLAFTIRRLPASISPASPTGAGNEDIDLTLSITGAPSNLEYVWDFADGPTVVTSTLTTTHRWATAGTYTTKVTARDKTTRQPVARASASVVITPPIQVWKFTSKSMAFSTSGNFSTNFGYNDGRWLVDSTILARIAAGVSQGGIRLVDAPFTPPGSPLRTAPAGVYLLEGASITLATLDDPATDNNFTTTTFPNAPLALPAAPRVSGWNLVQDAAPVNPLCNVHADSYTRTGTIISGRVTGLRVPVCVQSAILPNTNGQQLVSMEVDVQFSGEVASGTITISYHFYGDGLQSQFNAQRIGRLTFQATRVTQ